jgi:hypothetical protein
VAAGLIGAIFFVKDTRHHVAIEQTASTLPRLQRIFWDTPWRHRNLGSVTQAGMVNNLNDGMVRGIMPISLATQH